MFELPSFGRSAVLVSLDLHQLDAEESLSELKLLATSARLQIRGVIRGRVLRPDSATYAGKGKVEEIAAAVQESGAQLVIFNHELTPAQERNLEQMLGKRVVDRVSLILEIFAQRARSHEGKLQVELARLERLSTRLVRGWTHLERQRGGIGLRGGPGETQLEIDRRLLSKRVKTLRQKILQLGKQRAVQRASRNKMGVFKVSLVGYTNAGKSTLFNRLTGGKVYAADQLFATLDTTTRRVNLGPGMTITVSDTVGFIRDLPPSLIAAFRATLEETLQADLLLHVVDASSAVREQQILEVNKVLREISADEVQQCLVWNKIDRLPVAEPGVVRDEYGKLVGVRLSAATGAGIDQLRAVLLQAAEGTAKPSNRQDEAQIAVVQ